LGEQTIKSRRGDSDGMIQMKDFQTDSGMPCGGNAKKIFFVKKKKRKSYQQPCKTFVFVRTNSKNLK